MKTDTFDKVNDKTAHWFYYHFYNKRTLFWLATIFCFILIAFLIVILVLVSINLSREDNLQSQFNSKLEEGSLIKSLGRGLSDYFGKEITSRQSFCFSKKYRFNNDTNLPFKLRYNEIQDPSEFLYNKKDHFFMNQGQINLKTNDDKVIVEYYISSNLPEFSAIKFVKMDIDHNIKRTYDLCSYHSTSERKCNKFYGSSKFHEYYDLFEEDKHYNTLNRKQSTKNFTLNSDTYSTIHLILFYRNDGTLNRNLLGDPIFVLELLNC